MQSMARTLTVLSVAAALIGISWYAIAASCTGSLPPSNAIPGWQTMSGSTKSGSMGSRASYDAYDGAVEAMQAEGIAYFAQRMYKHSSTKKYLTVDVYQLTSTSKAQALYNKKKTGYKKANPLNTYTRIKDKAFVGTMGKFTFGVCQRGKYVSEVSMSKASTAQDRATVKSFLTYISKKQAS